MRLVYVSPVPWESFAQRPHKFVEWFHKRTNSEVLWINPYPTRFPKFSDLKRISSKQKSVSNSQPEWLTVLHAKALPVEPLKGSGKVNRLFWGSILSSVNRFCGSDKYLLAIGKPSELAIQLLREHSNSNVISLYDAMDDFPAFYSSLSRRAMASREKSIVSMVDTLWVSSSELKNRWQRYKPCLDLVFNGLDPAVLPEVEECQNATPSKVFGYLGTIGEWFDWELVLKIAEQRPEDKVKLIGPMHVTQPKKLPGNIEISPPCSHQEALLKMQEFDVGLIPFLQNDLTVSVDPIKFYEYRALGLPIISSTFGEMAYRGELDGVYLDSDNIDVTDLTEAALTYRPLSENLKQFIEMNAWDSRFDYAELAKVIRNNEEP